MENQFESELDRQRERARNVRARHDNPRQVLHVRQQETGKYTIEDIECDESELPGIGALTGFKSQRVELTYEVVEALAQSFEFERINKYY
jgi:hypothetical protein